MVPAEAPTLSPSSLEADARRLAAIAGRWRYWILFLLTVFYATGAIRHARSKPLWYDEIITTIAASAHTGSATIEAARQTDINPPLPHLLIHYTMQWVSTPEIGARIPSIVGFWIFCLCLYRFIYRRAGIFYAFAALLLPVVTSAYQYSVEARGYGPLLAFAGIALVAWQEAADRAKLWAVSALAVSLAAATMCHYFAVLLYLPLAGGEAFRWFRERKFAPGIWVAFAAGGAPLLWRIGAVIHGSTRLTAHTWSPPYPEQVLEFWQAGLQDALPFVVAFLAFLALTTVSGGGRREPEAAETAVVLSHELMACVLFLAIPLVAVMGALLVTHMFTARYALFALAGFVCLAPLLLAQLAGGRTLPGFLMAGVLMLGLGVTTLRVPHEQDPFRQEPLLARALQSGEVVIPDGQLFLQMWKYAPPALKSHLVFLADNTFAVKYMGFDTIDDGLRALRPWSSVRVLEYRDWVTPGREFLVYQNTFRPGWLVPEILAEEGQAIVEGYEGPRALLRIRAGHLTEAHN